MRGYRVFDTVEKKYCPNGFYLRGDGVLLENVGGAFTSLTPADPKRYIVEESTGLKDKNDKMIFEGDVVSFWPTLEHERGKIKCEITYSMHGFWAKEIDIEYDRKWIMYGDVEIIGNVHNNPELLEEKK